jgi:hypothetical protein
VNDNDPLGNLDEDGKIRVLKYGVFKIVYWIDLAPDTDQ